MFTGLMIDGLSFAFEDLQVVLLCGPSMAVDAARQCNYNMYYTPCRHR